MRQPIPPYGPLPARLLRGLLLCVIGMAITLGAPVLRAAGLFEEHPEHLVGTLGCFPQRQAAQTETRRRQPTVLPSAVLRRAGAIVGSLAAASGRLRRGHGLQWPPGRAPPADSFPAPSAA